MEKCEDLVYREASSAGLILKMDPISAAGIGLSVAALALQVFSGCVTGEDNTLIRTSSVTTVEVTNII